MVHFSRVRKTLLLGVSCLLMSTTAWAVDPTVSALQNQNPQRVLLVGNSYLYYGDSMHNMLRRMVSADQPDLKLQYKSATIGGASLDHHNMDWLTSPGKIGVKEPFELVILQGHSAAALNPKQSQVHLSASKDAVDLIRQRGGEVAIYMPPAYVPPHKGANAENSTKNREFYVKQGNDLGVLVLPVGLAFDEAYQKNPNIKLHKSYDGSHPSRAGTYLAAATIYAAVYGKSPVGNQFDTFDEVDPETRLFLQEVALDTVKKFYNR